MTVTDQGSGFGNIAAERDGGRRQACVHTAHGPTVDRRPSATVAEPLEQTCEPDAGRARVFHICCCRDLDAGLCGADLTGRGVTVHVDASVPTCVDCGLLWPQVRDSGWCPLDRCSCPPTDP